MFHPTHPCESQKRPPWLPVERPVQWIERASGFRSHTVGEMMDMLLTDKSNDTPIHSIVISSFIISWKSVIWSDHLWIWVNISHFEINHVSVHNITQYIPWKIKLKIWSVTYCNENTMSRTSPTNHPPYSRNTVRSWDRPAAHWLHIPAWGWEIPYTQPRLRRNGRPCSRTLVWFWTSEMPNNTPVFEIQESDMWMKYSNEQ